MDDELVDALMCEYGKTGMILTDRSARAILPIARKHYAEVFAKVAEDVVTDGELSREIGEAIRKAGEAQ